MINVYINYPVPHVTIHHEANLHLNENAAHRWCTINTNTLSPELLKFTRGEYKFSAVAGLNGLWLKIDLDDEEFEEAVVAHIMRILATQHRPFVGIPINHHG
jgi:hypothetical protein